MLALGAIPSIVDFLVLLYISYSNFPLDTIVAEDAVPCPKKSFITPK